MVGTSRFIVSKLCQLSNKSVGFDLNYEVALGRLYE